MNQTAPSHLVRRVCKGGCGGLFTPPASRPGQEYIHGHKKGCDWKRSDGNRLVARPTGRSEAERHALDYKMALASVRRELAEVEKAIDAVDDEIAPLRQALHNREAQKDALAEKHLNLAATAEALDALLAGRSLARELAAEKGGKA